MTRQDSDEGTTHDRLPIVFVHYGNKEYLRYGLRQARRSNPDASIYLLGDESNRGHEGVEHFLASEFSAEATEFEDLYRHLSTNSRIGELRCFQRWYVLRDFLKHSGITRCLYLDSDVLLFADVTAEAPAYADYDLALVRQYVPCTTFINDASVLEEFCEFLSAIYRRRRGYAWDYFVSSYTLSLKNRRAGGASDMTAFHLFHQEQFGRIGELGLISDESAYDISINAAEPGFEMIGGMKRLEWRDGHPYAFHRGTGRPIRMKSLHCQGRSKKKMAEYFETSTRCAEIAAG